MTGEATTLSARVRHEFIQYGVLCIYLYICFGAIFLYKTALLHGEGISYEPYGMAAIKALIIGKFIMIGHVAKIGERHQPQRLVMTVLLKGMWFLLLLIVLSAAEEVIRGLIHGRTIIASLADFQGGTLLQIFASSLLMLLILIPYLTFKELVKVLGSERMRALLLESRRLSSVTE